MDRPFSFLKLPSRPEKPRQVGITMVLDKNLGAQALKDLVEYGGDYIDILKFGWGTARLYPQKVLEEKILTLKNHLILSCPGGTFLEVACAKNKTTQFFREIKKIGFNCVEVSDGTVAMSRAEKLNLILQAKDAGFLVFSEVGKKNKVEDQKYSIQEKIDHALEEIRSGSFKVIMEARECGTQGIFDEKGEIIPEFLEPLVSQVGFQNLILEAPMVSQQQWLISNLGNTVNLGNVAPEDVLNLETLRCGLRSGTLKEYHLAKISLYLENGISGALHAAAKNNLIIVVDALRCSTTIISALAGGLKSVKTVTSIEDCVGEVTAGERGGIKISHLNLDNSPMVFQNGKFSGKELVLTATNGTECIEACAHSQGPILIGGMVNAKAVAQRALELAKRDSRDITIVMAGRNNQLAKEDLIAASEIASNLKECTLKGYIRLLESKDPIRDFLESDSGRNLVLIGKREDVLFCARGDLFSIVPEYKNGVFKI